MGDSYRIGDSYRDTRSTSDPENQFLSCIKGTLDSGIKNTGGIRRLKTEDGDELAALVLVSNDASVSQHEDPWDDTIALGSGYIGYWGDAKFGRPFDSTKENAVVRRAFERSAAGNREAVPPILVFHKPRSGWVQFCGLCIPDRYEVEKYRHEGEQIPNYLFHLTVLNAPELDVSWLHDRARRNGDARAPEAWREWVESGVARRWPTGERVDTTAGRAWRYDPGSVEVSHEFRETVFDRYGRTCALTGIESEAVLDLAHVLPRSEYPDLAEEPGNALVMNALHHRAFDAELFTLDTDRRIRVRPDFEPGHPFLRETLIRRAGERLSLPEGARLDPGYLEELNDGRSWV